MDKDILKIDETELKKREKVPCTQAPKFDVKVLVAGGFCAGGVSKLYFVPKGQTVTATYYQEHILPVYFEAMKSDIFSSKKNIVFQQDGVSAHTAKSTMKVLEEVRTVGTKEIWPGNSPDLNPIENLWAILKNSAYEEPVPQNEEELRTRFEEKLNSISLGLLKNLSSSFKKRVEEMIFNDGGLTRY